MRSSEKIDEPREKPSHYGVTPLALILIGWMVLPGTAMLLSGLLFPLAQWIFKSS